MLPTFGRPKKSAHYESNTPAHGAILVAPPVNVVIDVNFDLAKPSVIRVEKDGKDYGLGATEIDGNLLAMRRKMDPSAPDGVYAVVYKACWPDGSCHDGRFEFAVDRSKVGAYEDLRGRKDVTIDMKDIAFKPSRVRISKGTKVTWTNGDDVTHFVNTDSHPAHTYHLAQNSRSLRKGESFSYVFDTPGEYPYHCSAHAATMTASLLVE